jgi:hypothetical protein
MTCSKTYTWVICTHSSSVSVVGILMMNDRVTANKRISRHRLLVDTTIKGNLRGLLERGVQESMDKEEVFVRNIAPFTCFSLFFSLSLALTHILLSQPSQPYLFLFFIPLPRACTYSIRPARRVSPFSFIPCHEIDHLTAMCQPHGFVVTDRDCFQPIVAFVGFHVCPLSETKHGLCAVRF